MTLNHDVCFCKLLLFFIAFLFSGATVVVHAQKELNIIDSNYSIDSEYNIYKIGFSKNSNINYFRSDFISNFKLLDTDILIKNIFNSTIINTNKSDYRDNNELSILLNRSLFENFDLGLQNIFFYNSDSKSIGNNQLIDISIIPLLKYKLHDNISTSLGVGTEYNKRIKITTHGTAVKFLLKINQIEYEDIILNSDFAFNSTYVTNLLPKQSIKALVNLSAPYTDKDNIELNLSYSKNDKDFIYFLNNSQDNYLYERNSDNHYSSNLKVNYSPTNAIHVNSELEYNSYFKDKNYNNHDLSLLNSMFRRNSNFIKFILTNNIAFVFPSYKANLYIDYESNEETFNSNPISSELSTSTISNFQNMQKLNDYNSSKIRIALTNTLNIGSRDTLITNLTASLFRYNTPHKDNNDEHDISYSSIYLIYKHFVNRHFYMQVTGEVKNQHFVYINSENSAQSNTLKSIRLKPELIFTNKSLYYNPRLEILANYHIYEFQNQINGLNPYSFRQYSYIDSAALYLSNNYYISSNILYRYSLRGILNWGSFSEKPIRGNLEQMYRVIINNKFNNYTFGLGVGLYKVEQDDIVNSQWIPTSTIISPEALIGIEFSNNGTLMFSGKYDFQDNNNIKRQVANISIQTVIKF